jgi:hypothetical protein
MTTHTNPFPADTHPRALFSDITLVSIGVAASLGGLTLVLVIMFAGSDYPAWAWAAVGLIWPLGALASLTALRLRIIGPLLMIALGLAASLVFAWEYGMVFGVPLQAAGLAIAWRQG